MEEITNMPDELNGERPDFTTAPTAAAQNEGIQKYWNDMDPSRKKVILAGLTVVVGIPVAMIAGAKLLDSNNTRSEKPAPSSALPSPTKQAERIQFTSKDGRAWDCTVNPRPSTVNKNDEKNDTFGEIIQHHQSPQTKGKGVLQDEIDAAASYNIRRGTIKNKNLVKHGTKVYHFLECAGVVTTSAQPQPTPTQ